MFSLVILPPGCVSLAHSPRGPQPSHVSYLVLTSLPLREDTFLSLSPRPRASQSCPCSFVQELRVSPSIPVILSKYFFQRNKMSSLLDPGGGCFLQPSMYRTESGAKVRLGSPATPFHFCVCSPHGKVSSPKTGMTPYL